MTEHIRPFVRVKGDDLYDEIYHDKGKLPRIIRLMRAHFALAGAAMVVIMIALAASLYSEFDNVTIGSQLGLESARSLYLPDTQQTLILVMLAAVASLLFLRAMTAVGNSDRGEALWVCLGLLLLLLGLPIGYETWRYASRITDAEGMLARVLVEVPWVVYALAVLLIGQSVLAPVYYLSLSTRTVRAALATRKRPVPIIRHVIDGVIIVWFVVLLAAGAILGVLTSWLFELPAADASSYDLLYATSFDAYEDDWDVFVGRDQAEILDVSRLELLPENARQPSIDGKALVISYGTPMAGGVVWSTLDRVIRDFDLRVTIQQVNGAFDQNQFGVIFRYRDDGHFYIFRITSDGWYKLAKVDGGVEEIVSDWGQTTAIRMSVPDEADAQHMLHRANELRIVAHGDQIQFWVNGQKLPLCLRGTNTVSMWAGLGECFTADPVSVYRDNAFAQGRIALAAGTLDGSSIQVAFDDLVITGSDLASIENDMEEQTG